MSRAKQLASRFREVILDGQWIARTNCKAQIENLDWKAATRKHGDMNSIAVLTFHIDYYIGGVLKVLEGGTLDIRDKYSFDCPSINSQEDWSKIRLQLFNNSEQFTQLVEQLSNEQLDAPFVKIEYGTYERNIEAMIEHSYYHLGQISLIKKHLLVNN